MITVCNWATNIRFLRKTQELNQEEFAEKLGISRSKLNAHENGQTVNPTVEDLIRFSEYFGLSIDSLIKVNFSKLSTAKFKELEAGNDVYATGTKLRVLATTVDVHNNEQIEFVSQKARAGYLTGYGDPDFIQKLPVFSMPHLPKDRKFRMFPTVGDSMYPIPENAFVIGNFVEDWKSISSGTPCIIVMKDEGIVFKIVHNQIKQNKTLLLESLNKTYEPYEVNVAAIIEVWQFVNYITDTIPEAETNLEELAKNIREIKAEIEKIKAKK